MSSSAAVSSWSAAGATLARPTTSSLFPCLLHPENPVVFIDVSLPARNATTGRMELPAPEGATGFAHPAAGTHRVAIELFAAKAPALARNVYAMCTGTTLRVVNGHDTPVGYVGTAVYASIPGTSVTLGDVLRNDGTGMFSIYNQGNHFYAVPPFQKDVLVGDDCGLPMERGYVVAVPVPGLPSTVEGQPVSSSIQILLDAPTNMQTFADGALIVGRVVGRTPTEVERSIAHLQQTSKVVYQVLKAASSGASTQTDQVLPGVVLSGEL
jgi:hypothetical protein